MGDINELKIIKYKLSMKRSTFLIDDHAVILDGLKSLCIRSDSLEYVGSASCLESAKKKLRSMRNLPDIIICDFKLKDNCGLELWNDLVKGIFTTKFLVFSMMDDRRTIKNIRDLGCHAFVSKGCSASELFSAIQSCFSLQNRFHLRHPELSMTDLDTSNTSLSQREEEVLEYIMEGMTSKEIAHKLFISKRTVDNHRRSILKKMDARNIADVIRKFKQYRA